MIEYCQKCLMPSTRPRIVFKDGVCNACHWAEEKKGIDWKARAEEFAAVIGEHRGKGPYDCIVPCSGGKDSSVITWKLKHEHGLNPLLVCYGQLLHTDVGRRNLDRVAQECDILYWRVNQSVSRKLARRFFLERGHPKQHYDSAVNAVPLITAVKFGIPLVFFAEFGELEYGGLVLDEESKRTRNLTEVLEHQVGDDARNWATDGISEADLYPYIYPALEDIERVGVKAYYFSYFFGPWDIYENAKFAREKIGFEQAGNLGDDGNWWRVRGERFDPPIDIDGRLVNARTWTERIERLKWLPEWWGKSDGSFEGFDSLDDCLDDLDYFMCYVKFLLGRSTRMASRLIQNGHITREQGLELVRRYDGEYPRTYLPLVLEYLGMTETEMNEIVDRHRNPELWVREGGEWKPRFHPA